VSASGVDSRADVLEHGPGTRPFDSRRAVVVGLVAVLVLVGVAFEAFASVGDVPRGTHVLGVDLGARSRSEAEQILRDHVAGRAGDAVRIRLDGRGVRLRPADIGLSLDVDATVGRAIRTGARDVPPVVRLDPDRLEAELRRRLDPARLTMRRPGISFAGLTAVPAYPQAGLDLDMDAAVATVRLAWPIGAAAEVPLVHRTPATTRAQVDAMIADLAEPAVAAPVTVTVGARRIHLGPAAIAQALVFRSDSDGLLTPAVDGARLHAAAAGEFARVERTPGPSRPPIRSGAPGRAVDLDRLGPDLLAVLDRPAPRIVPAALVPVRSARA
jgi:hypothetical protein